MPRISVPIRAVWLSLLICVGWHVAPAQGAEALHLLSVNFGSGTRTGVAAIGNGTNDVWNLATAGTNVTLTNLLWATSNNATGVTLTYSNLTGLGTNGISDTMMNSFVGSLSYDTNTSTAIPASLTVSNLPAGTYELYLYALGSYYGSSSNYDNETFRISVAGGSFSGWLTTVHPGVVDTNWTEGVQYVRFTNVVVGSNEVVYVQLGGGLSGIHVLNGLQIIDPASTNGLPALPNVVFDPVSGTGTPASVTLAVPGHGDATIYYTTNGVNPDTNSTVYVAPIEVEIATTIKAFATKSGYSPSSISTATYPLSVLPLVTFNPADGAGLPTNVVLSVSGHTNATIYYTTNGVTPTTNSAIYTGAIALNTNGWSYSANRVPAMTDYNLPSGSQVTHSSELAASTDYSWKAFDHATNAAWSAEGTNSEWVAIEFPSSRQIARYAVTATAAGDAPKNWTFEGWNGSSYVVIDTRRSQTNWTNLQRREYICTNSNHFQKYRLNVSVGNVTAGNTGGIIKVGEIEMFEASIMVMAFTTQTNWIDSAVSMAEYHARPEDLQNNHVPTATPQTLTVLEDASLSITLNGTDADYDPLSYTIVNNPTNGVLTGTAPNVIYLPNTNFFGTDAFTFRVNDGRTNSSSATVSITVQSTDVVMAWLAPLANSTNKIGSGLDLSVAVTDPAHKLLEIQYYVNGSLLGSVTNSPYIFTWVNPPISTNTIMARGLVSSGANVTSVINNVVVDLPGRSRIKVWLNDTGLSGLTNGAAVATWYDSSGAANNFSQSNPWYRPLLLTNAVNGLPAIQLDGGDDGLAASTTSATNDFTVFVVSRTAAAHDIDSDGDMDQDAGQRYLFSPRAPGSAYQPQGYFGVSSGTNGVTVYEYNYNPYSIYWTKAAVEVNIGTNFSLYTFSVTNGQSSVFVNGALMKVGRAAISNQIWAPFCIGRGEIDSAFAGEVAEVIIYSKTLESTERVAVESYLAKRFVLVTNAPTTPTNVLAVAVSPTRTVVSWSKSETAASYIVERALGTNETFTAVGTVGAPVFTWLDTALSAGTTARYRVVAMNLAGNSAPSDAKEISTPSTGGDFPISSLRLWLNPLSGVATDASGNLSSWSDASGFQNDAYQADGSKRPFFSQNGTNVPVVLFDGSNDGLTLVKTAATNEFTIVVAGYATLGHDIDTEGASDPDAGQRYLFDPRVPGREFTTPGYSGVSFGTNGVSVYEFSYPYNAYTDVKAVYEEALGTNMVVMSVVYTGKVPSLYVNGSLKRQGYGTTNDTVYAPMRIGVAGFTGAQFQGGVAEVMIFNGALSDSERFAAEQYLNVRYAMVHLAPNAPTNILVSALSQSQAEIYWQAVGSGGAGYLVEKKTGTNGIFTVIGSSGAQENAYFDSGLSAGETYGYRVAAYNLQGISAYSDTVYATTPTNAAPMDISGLKIWLKGQSGVVSDVTGKINTWYDQSGNGNHAKQSASDYRPAVGTNYLNGLPVVSLDGSNDGMTLPAIVATNNFTILTVVRPTQGHDLDAQGASDDDGAQKFLFDPNVPEAFLNPQAFLGLSVGTNGVSAYEFNYLSNASMTARAVAVTALGTNGTILTMTVRDGQPWLYANGRLVRVGEKSAYAQVVTPLQIGKRGSTYSSAYGGDVAEILIYNKSMTDTERMAVEQVLNRKYAAVTNLPSIPEISALADVTTDEDTPVTTAAFRVFDAQTAAADLTLTVTSSNTNLVSAVNAYFSGSGTNRTLTLTPSTNANGSALITVYVADTDGNTNASQFQLTVNPVNDVPVVFDFNILVAENSTNQIGLTGLDVDEDLLTYAILSSPTNGVLTGPQTNRFYIPNAGFVGMDSFTYVAMDGSSTSLVATVSIQVYGLTNRLPVADSQSLTVLENGELPVRLTGSDFESSVLGFFITSTPTNGTLSGAVPNLVYHPNQGFSGNDTFAFKVNDGVTNSTAAVISITVASVNDAPSLGNLTNLTVLEDSSIALIPLLGISPGSTNESTQTLMVSAFTVETNLIASLMVNYTNQSPTGSLAIILRSNANGTALIHVVVSDDGGVTNGGVDSVTNSFYLTIVPVNDSPVVQLTSPTNLSSLVGPTNLLITSTASDPDNDLESVSFYAGTKLLGTVTEAPYQLTWSNALGGAWNLTARAVDRAGLSSTSTVVSITIDLPDDSDYDGRNDREEMADGTDEFDSGDVSPVRLANFFFDERSLAGERGQLPVTVSNVNLVANWRTNAVEVTGTNPVRLVYAERENDGSANVNLREGTLRLWYKPYWGGTNVTGSGPGTNVCLLSVGDNTNGVWGIWVNAAGTELSLISATNGVAATNFVGQISWRSNLFHQLAVVFGPTNSGFYLDGGLVTNGNGVIYYPSASARQASGLNIGTNPEGGQVAKGQFDEIETFNYQLSGSTISTNYNSLRDLVDSDMDGLSDRQEIEVYGTDPTKADSDGDGITDGVEVSRGTNPLLADGNADPDGDGVDTLTELLLGRNPLIYGITDDILDLNRLRVFTPLKP